MIKVSFERAISYKNKEYILTGTGLERLSGSSSISKKIKSKTPISFEKISDYILKKLGYLGYISFWDEIEIFEVRY